MVRVQILKRSSRAVVTYVVGVLYGVFFLFLLSYLQLDALAYLREGVCLGCRDRSESDHAIEVEPMHTRQRKQLSASLTQSLDSMAEARRFDTRHNDNGVIRESPSLNSILPAWMKEYFAWHKNSLKELNADHSKWTNYKYLVVRCLTIDHKCGGASDRLQSIPLALLVASQHERLLFIEWEKPAVLTEFLTPTALDWRLPAWFQKGYSKDEHLRVERPYIHFQRSPSILSDKHLSRLDQHKNMTSMDMRYQTTDHGRAYYNSFLQSGEPDFDQVYAAAWASLFRPSPPIQARINNAVTELGLQEGNYVSLHVRSMYYKDKSRQVSRVENAVDCAALLGTIAADDYDRRATTVGGNRALFDATPTIYVASDSPAVVQAAIAYGQRSAALGRKVVAAAHSMRQPPLHLDRGSNFVSSSPNASNWMEFPAADYYDIFVDLYLLSQGRCVAHGVGGYGHWASHMALNGTCESLSYRDGNCKKVHLPS